MSIKKSDKNTGLEHINFKIIPKEQKKKEENMGNIVPIDRRSRTVDREEIDSEYHGDIEE